MVGIPSGLCSSWWVYLRVDTSGCGYTSGLIPQGVGYSSQVMPMVGIPPRLCPWWVIPQCWYFRVGYTSGLIPQSVGYSFLLTWWGYSLPAHMVGYSHFPLPVVIPARRCVDQRCTCWSVLFTPWAQGRLSLINVTFPDSRHVRTMHKLLITECQKGAPPWDIQQGILPLSHPE